MRRLWLLLVLAGCGPKPDTARDAFIAAAGDLTQLEARLEDSLRKRPEDPLALNWRGRLKLDALDFRGAVEDFSEAIRLDPKLAAAWYNRGNARLDLGDYQAALLDLGEAARLDASLVGAPYSAGLVKQALGDHQGAQDAFRLALKATPSLEQALLRRARSLDSLGEEEEALKLLDTVLRGRSDSYLAWVQRGQMHQELYLYETAAADFSRAVELSPGHPAALSARAAVLDAGGKELQAIEDYTAAIALEPADASLYQSRGHARYHGGRYAEAVEDWRKAVALNAKKGRVLKAYIEYAERKLKP